MRVPRRVLVAEGLGAVLAVAGFVATAGDSRWYLPLFFLLVALAVASDLLPVDVTEQIRISGSFVAFVLAMVLLGPAPAAVMGVISIVVGWLRDRDPIPALRNNLVVFALYPLAGGMAFHAARDAAGVGTGSPIYYLLVLGTFGLALGINFVLVASYEAAVGHASFGESVREALLPLLSSQGLTALLTVAASFLYAHAGIAGMVLAGLAIVAFQHLLAALLLSRQRAAQLEERTQQLHRIALTDELTGLGNRRRLMEDLEARVRLSSEARPLLLVYFDLDGFKQYNDLFGHPEGDLLLRRLGQRLAAAVRGRGSAYRPGGDEFCLLAHLDRQADPQALVEAANEALTEHGRGFSVRSSHGAVLIPDEATDAADALRLADQRMYARKDSRPASAKRQARDLLLTVLAEQQPDLHDHLSDVATLAVAIARELGMSDGEVDDIARAAELHDVGKIAIPEAILNKEGPLDDDEWQYMRRHTLIGERMLEAAPSLRGVARLVRSSHERWDGKGYPDGLTGEEIPLGSRIIAVCDSFDAMLSRRPYKRSRSTAWALRELRRCAGTQFDPRVVDAFARHVRRATGEDRLAAAK